MNKKELMERLSILQQSDSITAQAAKVTEKAFDYLRITLCKDDIEQGEMMFTHLPFAMTRLSAGEIIEGPSEAIINEAKSTRYAERINTEIFYLETQWGKELPQAEKDYLFIHYSLIFQVNLGGESK